MFVGECILYGLRIVDWIVAYRKHELFPSRSHNFREYTSKFFFVHCMLHQFSDHQKKIWRQVGISLFESYTTCIPLLFNGSKVCELTDNTFVNHNVYVIPVNFLKIIFIQKLERIFGYYHHRRQEAKLHPRYSSFSRLNWRNILLLTSVRFGISRINYLFIVKS